VSRDLARGESEGPEANPIGGEEEEDANGEMRKRNSRSRYEALAAVVERPMSLMWRPEPLNFDDWTRS
jgi:hypothetical protein